MRSKESLPSEIPSTVVHEFGFRLKKPDKREPTLKYLIDTSLSILAYQMRYVMAPIDYLDYYYEVTLKSSFLAILTCRIQQESLSKTVLIKSEASTTQSNYLFQDVVLEDKRSGEIFILEFKYVRLSYIKKTIMYPERNIKETSLYYDPTDKKFPDAYYEAKIKSLEEALKNGDSYKVWQERQEKEIPIQRKGVEIRKRVSDVVDTWNLSMDSFGYNGTDLAPLMGYLYYDVDKRKSISLLNLLKDEAEMTQIMEYKMKAFSPFDPSTQFKKVTPLVIRGVLNRLFCCEFYDPLYPSLDEQNYRKLYYYVVPELPNL